MREYTTEESRRDLEKSVSSAKFSHLFTDNYETDLDNSPFPVSMLDYIIPQMGVTFRLPAARARDINSKSSLRYTSVEFV